MQPPVLERNLETLELMARAEETVQRLYATCAVLWKENEDFWRGLAGEERRHVTHIRSMIAMITANPGRFQPGRPFSAAALKTFIDGIERDIDRVQQAGVPVFGQRPAPMPGRPVSIFSSAVRRRGTPAPRE